MKSLLYTLLIVLTSQHAFSQSVTFKTIVNSHMMPGKKDWIRTKAFPNFKTQQDSIECLKVTLEMFEIFRLPKRTPVIEKRLDSLLKRSTYIMTERINGYRTVIYPSPKLYSYDSLKLTKDYSSVKQISISNVKEFPLEVFNCKQLEQIELVNTSIEKLPEELNTLVSLTFIDIYNHKSKQPLQLSANKNIRKMSIQYTKSASLPISFEPLENLETLLLTHNDLTTFINGAKENSKLKELDLSYNALTLNNDLILRHKYLQLLTVSHNTITGIPKSIKKLKNVTGLIVAFNTINTVSPAIRKLKKLELLSFYENQLSIIPKGVYKLKRLQELDLNTNQLETIPKGIGGFRKMEILHLAFNKIIFVSDELGKLKTLREIYLHDNRIGSLPNTIGNLNQLTVLRLNNNYLSNLPSSFSNLSLLENLDLAKNRLSLLDLDLNAFHHLATLEISENPWTNPTVIDAQIKPLSESGVIVKNFPVDPDPLK